MGAAGIFGIVGAAEGTIGTIAANLAGDQTRHELLRLREIDPKYKTSNPYSGARVGAANNFLNARTPGMAGMTQNIYGNSATQMNNINQNATDGSQLLAMGGQVSGAAGKSFADLGQYDDQNYMQRYKNWDSVVNDEGTKIYQGDVRNWQDQVNIAMARNGIRQQQGANMMQNGAQWASVGGMGGSSGGAGAK